MYLRFEDEGNAMKSLIYFFEMLSFFIVLYVVIIDHVFNGYFLILSVNEYVGLWRTLPLYRSVAPAKWLIEVCAIVEPIICDYSACLYPFYINASVSATMSDEYKTFFEIRNMICS